MQNNSPHSFHIPVMGTGYTIDSPVRVAQYGISSVISLVDDMLIEKMRKFYSDKFELPFQEISAKVEDFRAKRITSYLNMVDDIVNEKLNEVKQSFEETGSELEKYVNMLPDLSSIKDKFNKFIKGSGNRDSVKQWINENITGGSIDVNIMTKLDKQNDASNVEMNDAHAALRGFANSNLSSSVVLSAGMNPSLYAYIAGFSDFYPNKNGEIKKKVTLKVSDYRSALIQGKYLAKRGIWVSEYRIESGLNCGGHAFASEGYLIGPILQEFKDNREELVDSTFKLLADTLKEKDLVVPDSAPEVRISAQGGVGTSEEHTFLLDNYNLNSIGWGSPFLLVPEASAIDTDTIELLKSAKEEDLYTSDVSPLGVPFNNVRNNTKDNDRDKRIAKGKPGSGCPKRYLALNAEYEGETLCTASRKYQKQKIEDLNQMNLSADEYKKRYDQITVKSCICVGLGTSSLIASSLDTKIEGKEVSVCPGPNIAYFDKEVKLTRMVDHIYGRDNIITDDNRPNMFVKELNMYVDHLKKKFSEATLPLNRKDIKYFKSFKSNLLQGIDYYKNMFSSVGDKLSYDLDDLDVFRNEIDNITV